METQKLTINPELRDLLPPLSVDEKESLEDEISMRGCLIPIATWNNTIVDGHNRYEICTRLGIPFETKPVEFKSIDDAKFWIWQFQKDRRPMSEFYRGEMALKLKDFIAAQAKERQRSAGGSKNTKGAKALGPKLGQAQGRTERELARIAQVSHGTMGKIVFLVQHADEATKERLRRNEKGTSIHREYTRVKTELEALSPPKPKRTRSTKTTANSTETTKASPKRAEPQVSEAKTTATATKSQSKAEAKSESEPSFRTGLYCRPGEKPGATGEPYVTSSSLTDLPHNQPEVLVAQLIAHFPREYTRKCPFLIFDALRANDGSETTIPLAKAIAAEFGDQ